MSATRFALLALLALNCWHLEPAYGLSFWDSQYSTSEFTQYLYKDRFMVTIFQHIKKPSTFYITPLVLLDHNSGSLRHNALTELWEVRFNVIMWNSELLESVTNHLRTVTKIASPEVKLLPMEKARFDWRSKRRPLKPSMVLENAFIAVHHLPNILTMTFACTNGTECGRLMAKVMEYPDSADSLVLDCFMTAQKSVSKMVNVTTENVRSSQTFSKLLSLPADGNFRYMRNEDFNAMVQETFSSVRATTIRSSEYVEKYDELNIMKLIENALRDDEVSASALSAAKWNSVFWDPAFARPDRVVREATRAFTKQDSTGQLKVNKDYLAKNQEASSMFSKGSYSSRLEASVDFSLFSASASIESSSSHEHGSQRSSQSELRDTYSKDELNKLLQERNLDVEWDGERFIVKPMSLIRINPQSFSSRRQLVSNNMHLSIYQQTISLKVIVTPEQNESSLLGDKPAPGSFPTHYSYCLLSNGGSCPPGFTRSSGYMKAIQMDSSDNMIKNARLGDSAIRCHSPGDSDNCTFRSWEPFKGELHLHVCCR